MQIVEKRTRGAVIGEFIKLNLNASGSVEIETAEPLCLTMSDKSTLRVKI